MIYKELIIDLIECDLNKLNWLSVWKYKRSIRPLKAYVRIHELNVYINVYCYACDWMDVETIQVQARMFFGARKSRGLPINR